MNLYKLDFAESRDLILNPVLSRETTGNRLRYASDGMTNTVKTDIIMKNDHRKFIERSDFRFVT